MSTFTVQVNCAVTPINWTIELYSRWGQFSNYNYNLYYQIGNGSTVYWGTVNSTTCGNLETILVPDGSTLYVYATNASTDEQVYIQGAFSNVCPGNLNVTCVYSQVITAGGSIAITVYVDGNGNPAYCT